VKNNLPAMKLPLIGLLLNLQLRANPVSSLSIKTASDRNKNSKKP